jgi:hypothetical protein
VEVPPIPALIGRLRMRVLGRSVHSVLCLLLDVSSLRLAYASTPSASPATNVASILSVLPSTPSQTTSSQSECLAFAHDSVVRISRSFLHTPLPTTWHA